LLQLGLLLLPRKFNFLLLGGSSLLDLLLLLEVHEPFELHPLLHFGISLLLFFDSFLLFLLIFLRKLDLLEL
jgi:hypothetical protein